MKIRGIIPAMLLAAFLWTPVACSAQARWDSASLQPALSGTIVSAELESYPEAAGAQHRTQAELAQLYANGTRAINEGRWPDAEAIFTKVASQAGPHADGALYWKAYAENKLGQTKSALDTCYVLRHDFPSSSWIHECGALEIEIHAQSGKPAEPKPGDDDDLKLLALNAMLRFDEPRAMAEIQEILNGDSSSEKLRKEAQFILGDHYSDATYAQIARIAYVEGDVRISRGNVNEKATGAVWEQAAADLPLETGFSLVTGAGRAEVEFEDASTVYLGENSVLVFNDLHTTGGVPFSSMALLAGTVTLHLRPYIAGEAFFLKTPTDELLSKYPGKAYLRIGSYLDAISVTPLEDDFLLLPGPAPQAVHKGQTQVYRQGRRIDAAETYNPAAFAEWDNWVADRVEERSAANAEVMRASGLTAPIPGLAEMNGQGAFFDCAPYGTCWEPNAADGPAQPGDKLADAQPLSPQASQLSAREDRANSSATAGLAERKEFFPCVPSAIRYHLVRDRVTGRQQIVDWGVAPMPARYDWAVCHAGSWIQRNHRYVWVVGHKRHHIVPIRWVKSGRTVAYVPIHPYDVKSRPPINRTDRVFSVNNRNGLSVEPVRFAAGRPIEWLQSPPREFRNEFLPPLAKADEPRMEAHSMKDATAGSKDANVKPAAVPLTFDRKSGSFMMPQHLTQGNRSVTVMAPITNRSGTLQSRGVSFSGSGSHGSGFSGGGSHSGGGSGGGSSGSHSGSGGSSSASSSSASSSSAASSSAHH